MIENKAIEEIAFQRMKELSLGAALASNPVMDFLRMSNMEDE